jgi:hypothetical protein
VRAREVQLEGDSNLFVTTERTTLKLSNKRNALIVPDNQISMGNGNTLIIGIHEGVDLEKNILTTLPHNSVVFLLDGTPLVAANDIPAHDGAGNTLTLEKDTPVNLKAKTPLRDGELYTIKLSAKTPLNLPQGTIATLSNGNTVTLSAEKHYSLVADTEVLLESDALTLRDNHEIIQWGKISVDDITKNKNITLLNGGKVRILNQAKIKFTDSEYASLAPQTVAIISGGKKILEGGFLSKLKSSHSLADFGSLAIFLLLAGSLLYSCVKKVE